MTGPDVRLFMLAGEQVETGRNVRPVFESPKQYLFGTQQAVFSVTRNIFGNAKQLAHKGEESSSEVVAFYRAPHVPRPDFNRRRVFDTLRAKFDVMEQKKSPQKRGKGGRPPKTDPAKNCLMVRFTDEEYARFLTMFEQSGVLSKAQFIKARVFDATFRVIQKDHGTMEVAARLTTFLAQFRKIGVNYNQVVKELNTHFSQKKALALLYKLENETRDLIAVSEKILALTEEFRQRW